MAHFYKSEGSLWRIAPILLGIAAFFVVIGPRALNPENVAWLANGDPATHYLGWLFFRNSEWSFPLGLNPSYGLELGSSIILSDSNPLLAFLFKPFDSILPQTFQYFGFWLLACFLLQAWFGWKLAGLASRCSLFRTIAAGIFVFSPPMLWRLNGHLSLVGHFYVLAALYLVFSPPFGLRLVKWAVLLVMAAMTHPYFWVMGTVLWIVDLSGRLLRLDLRWKPAASEFLLVTIAVAFAMWQVGYFAVSDGASAGGYGFYRMNLLSIVDPSGWSHGLKDIPESGGEYEGFNYLGSGIIVLCLFAVPALLTDPLRLRKLISIFPTLVLALLVLTAFAVTHKVGIASKELTLHVPEGFLRIASVFRASGRMFWPVYYVIVFGAIFFVARGYPKAAIPLMAIALLVQVVDLRAGYMRLRSRAMVPASSSIDSTLVGPAWDLAAERYRKVRWILPVNDSPHWQALAAYAGLHQLSTDAVYLGRVSISAVERARETALTRLRRGEFEPDSLYFLDDASFGTALARRRIGSSDLLAKVDGLNVLAPGWKDCAACPPLGTEVPPPPAWELGVRLGTNLQGAGVEYLGTGWSAPEAWGIWSDGSEAMIFLPLSGQSPRVLKLELMAFVSPAHPKQRVEVSIGGNYIQRMDLTLPERTTMEIEIPRSMLEAAVKENQLKVRLIFPDNVSPKDLNLSSDSRKLGVGLLGITLR